MQSLEHIKKPVSEFPSLVPELIQDNRCSNFSAVA